MSKVTSKTYLADRLALEMLIAQINSPGYFVGGSYLSLSLALFSCYSETERNLIL